ncbi:MAG TPA: hypothetical protein VMF89_16285 [Polyangiales bacterium]|nr:hypothetical protein [Polyangiales bacterium]
MSSRIVDSQPPEAAWSEVERELLGAAREERMPAELEARLRDALAFPAGAAAVPTQASVEPAPRGSLDDVARARQLFASKLPLWGMLSVVALGAVSYYVLSSTASQPTAASRGQRVAFQTGTATNEAAQLEASTSESASAQRDGTGPASASAYGDGDREAANAQRSASSLREGSGSASVNARAEVSGEATRTQRGGGRERTPSAPRQSAAYAQHEPAIAAGGAGQAPASPQHAAASAARNGAGEASVRARAATVQRDESGHEVARARGGKLPAASSARLRAADPPLAPLTAAENTAEQAARSDVTPTHEADKLRLEAQLLELARSALGHGALPEARQWLARYQARFARGALQPESQVLGIELAVRTGARTAAKSQAEQFLARHPNHPLRDRVQLLTEQPR